MDENKTEVRKVLKDRDKFNQLTVKTGDNQRQTIFRLCSSLIDKNTHEFDLNELKEFGILSDYDTMLSSEGDKIVCDSSKYKLSFLYDVLYTCEIAIRSIHGISGELTKPQLLEYRFQGRVVREEAEEWTSRTDLNIVCCCMWKIRLPARSDSKWIAQAEKSAAYEQVNGLGGWGPCILFKNEPLSGLTKTQLSKLPSNRSYPEIS